MTQWGPVISCILHTISLSQGKNPLIVIIQEWDSSNTYSTLSSWFITKLSCIQRLPCYGKSRCYTPLRITRSKVELCIQLGFLSYLSIYLSITTLSNALRVVASVIIAIEIIIGNLFPRYFQNKAGWCSLLRSLLISISIVNCCKKCKYETLISLRRYYLILSTCFQSLPWWI